MGTKRVTQTCLSCGGSGVYPSGKTCACGGSGTVSFIVPVADPPTQNTDSDTKKGCFIATAAFGNYHSPEVVFLRAFRDESLSKSFFGRIFIQIYYFVSPSLAAIITTSELLKMIVRKVLQPIIFLLRYFKN